MEAPPLRRRVTVIGVVVVLLVLLAFNAFVYVSLRGQMEASLDELLGDRAELAASLGDDLEAEALVEQLTRVGVPALVRTVDGRELRSEPATPRVGGIGPPTSQTQPQASLVQALPDGSSVEVFASRAGIETTLNRLLLLLAVGTLGAIALAGVLLQRAVRPALAPLDKVVETAERTAAGATGARLRPDRNDTELGRMAVAFDDMLDALEAAREGVDEERDRTQRFLADAAHQLRTPITGFRTAVELLLQDPEPEDRERALAHAVRESAKAGGLISALLRMARLEQPDRLRPVPTDVLGLCRAEVERARQVAPQLAVELDEGAVPEHKLMVVSEEVADAIANLLDNARGHARNRVRVTISEDPVRLVIRVDDDGPGLPEHARDLAFERFTTLDGHGGSGLGLPIARAVARAHGGELVYESGGFVLWLPVVTR